jgi:hypothetical protein
MRDSVSKGTDRSVGVLTDHSIRRDSMIPEAVQIVEIVRARLSSLDSLSRSQRYCCSRAWKRRP